MSEYSISIRGVNKSFGSTHAVRNLDLNVPHGSLCGFLGPNGAGKSTTIRMIMSIIYPDSGSIQVLGGSALKNKDRIGFLPEERGLYRRMRVGEFLEYIVRLKGFAPPGSTTITQHVQQWLERIELPGVYRKRCQELSKGMQQKVQFLAAVIHDPDLVILDEPYSGLDPVNSAVMSHVIRELHGRGKTVIFSTHVLQQAEELCDRIFLIHRGMKLLDATLEDIHRKYDPKTVLVEPMNGEFNPARVPGVVNCQTMRGNGVLELTLAQDADPQCVMRHVLDVAPMRSVELRRPTLTDVFIQLVKQDQGVVAAEQAAEELNRA